MPEHPRMDSHLVWDPAEERLDVREFRLIRRGDLVAAATAEDGSEGVFVWDKGFADEADVTQAEAFAFMASEVSREKPVNYDAIFDRFIENRGARGFILWVIGPALVHARGREALACQAAMRDQTTRATMVVMVATALHSIAAGNMLPTYCTAPDGSIREITTICVDQTEVLVSKLKDRGTHQAFGVVTNAQDFMRLLQLELGARIRSTS
jgi:hypothetical protein